MKYQLGVRIDTTVGLLKWPDVFYSVREKASDLIRRWSSQLVTVKIISFIRILTTFELHKNCYSFAIFWFISLRRYLF